MDVNLGYHEARLTADEVVDGEEDGLCVGKPKL